MARNKKAVTVGKGLIAQAVGRRKEATANVRLLSPEGKESAFIINGKDFGQYFLERPLEAKKLLLPLETSGLKEKVAIRVKVSGGGKAAQVDAITLGIARAVVSFDPSLKPLLRRQGLLTRDPRQKERKKPGFLRARKKPQYSKR